MVDGGRSVCAANKPWRTQEGHKGPKERLDSLSLVGL